MQCPPSHHFISTFFRSASSPRSAITRSRTSSSRPTRPKLSARPSSYPSRSSPIDLRPDMLLSAIDWIVLLKPSVIWVVFRKALNLDSQCDQQRYDATTTIPTPTEMARMTHSPATSCQVTLEKSDCTDDDLHGAPSTKMNSLRSDVSWSCSMSCRRALAGTSEARSA